VGAVLGECAYEKPIDVLLRKLGVAPAFSGNAFTAWGQRYEPIAQRLYTARTGLEVQEFGLIPHATIPFLGASPDGITPNGRMLEIKCPSKRVIDGNVPQHYYLQMQLQMEVCDLDVCDFLECRFSEYASREDFEADCDPEHPERSRRSGLARGILVAAPDGSHHYPVSLEEAEKMPGKIVYWCLEQMSLVEVQRDRMWFAEARPRLEAFWKDVCYYRIMGTQHVRDMVPAGAKYKEVRVRLGIDPSPVMAMQGFRYLPDSDEDEKNDEVAWRRQNMQEEDPTGGGDDSDDEMVF
jgi:putative phage-type endonuclease